MPAYDRIDRISEEIRRNVDKIIREDVRDPRIDGTWSLVRAEATRDLRYCKIRVSILESDKRAPMMDALKKASGFIRRELSHRMMLRYTPELLFELDVNIEYAAHINELLRAAAHGGVVRLRHRRETLEDYFMRFYKEDKTFGGVA